MSVVPLRVPSPAERPEEFSAEELILELRRRGARVYRMQAVGVFCLTNDPNTAKWLHKMGASPYLPRNAERSMEGMPAGAYRRERGGKVIEWDFYIHRIEVVGEETVWEAAGRLVETVRAEDFA